MVTYTTRGSVRGGCGHKHRTIKAAARCANEDQAECQKQGGYSDRELRRTDGKELTEDEVRYFQEAIVAEKHGSR